jgi:hypothetical protein
LLLFSTLFCNVVTGSTLYLRLPWLMNCYLCKACGAVFACVHQERNVKGSLDIFLLKSLIPNIYFARCVVFINIVHVGVWVELSLTQQRQRSHFVAYEWPKTALYNRGWQFFLDWFLGLLARLVVHHIWLKNHTWRSFSFY